MYLCLDCNELFEDPRFYSESHDLDTPPYETWWGCPSCAGVYVEAERCSECGEWITGEYIELKDGTVICENCYEIKDVERNS